METESQFNPSENPEKKKVLESITFTEEKDKDGNITGYRSSSPDRKSIKLSPDSPEPTPGKDYTVEILEDTDPENPMKGKYIARIMEGRSSAVYEEKGEEIEENVNEAEKAKRKLGAAGTELYEETGLTKQEREELENAEIFEDEVIQEISEELEGEKLALEAEVEGFLGEEGSPERALVSLRHQNLFRALRLNKEIELEREKLLEKESSLLKKIDRAQDEGRLRRGASMVLEKTREAEKNNEEKREELLHSTPEAYYGLHLKELKEYKDELETGNIVETPYVREKEEEMTAYMRAGIPVFLYGHLGSGKTELAMHLSRKMLKDRIDEKMEEWDRENPEAEKEERAKKYEELQKQYGEAVVISGSKHTSLAELYGHQVLSLDKIDEGELDAFLKKVEKKFEEWVEENPDAKEEEKNRAHQRILEVYSSQLKSGTISDFFLGPVYQAAKEGRPLILDEVNAIPHEVLISLNHILTRKPGDVINVQQDSGEEITVEEGFAVIMTGNLNKNGTEQYIDRSVMDPAFLSRLHRMEYDYLPQKTEGSLEEEAGPENELFQLMLSYLMDKHGNIEAPKDTPKKLWDLARMARITQDIFSGKDVNTAYYFQEAGGRNVKPMLKENVLSIRAIGNILQAWRKDDFKNELDFYVWQSFISEATTPAEKAYLYQLFHTQSTLFKSSGWEDDPNYGSGGKVGSFDIKPPKNAPPEKAFFGPRDTVDFAFGKGPERTEWPKHKGENPGSYGRDNKAEKTVENLKAKGELEDFLKGL